MKLKKLFVLSLFTNTINIQTLCRILNVDIQGYYLWRNRRPSRAQLRHNFFKARIVKLSATPYRKKLHTVFSILSIFVV